MAKLRSISTEIWADTWFEELQSDEKLLFIYLITNEKNNMLEKIEKAIKMDKSAFRPFFVGNQ